VEEEHYVFDVRQEEGSPHRGVFVDGLEGLAGQVVADGFD